MTCRSTAAAGWTEQGPGPNVVSGFGYTEVTGAVEVIAADPVNPSRVFVGTVNGGVWRTNDAMSARPTWVPLTDQEASLSIDALAFDPTDPTHNTLYAGFGSVSRGLPHNGGNHGPLAGLLLKTTDGGATWTTLPVDAFTGQRVRKILPTPLTTGSGQVILVATDFWEQGLPGVHRSADGGLTWTLVLLGNAFDLVEDPSTPTRLFAARRGGVFRSDDGGQSWIDVTAGLGLAPGGNNVIHLAISPTTDTLGRHWLFAASHGVGVFTSTDQGATWTPMDQPFPDGSRAGGTNEGVAQLVVSPLDPSQVFASGDSPSWWRGDAEAAPGSQWFALSGGNTGFTAPHTDSRSWAFSADSNVAFESDDGGIYRLVNAHAGAPHWESANGSLRVAEFLSIAYDSVNHVIFGACWDNSIPRQTTLGNIVWGTNERLFGDGVQVGVDNGTPGVSVHYSSQQFLFGAQRSSVSTGGTTTTDLGLDIDVGGGQFLHYNFLEGNIDPSNDNDLGTVRFIQTWAVHENDGQRLLLGTDYLYESFDRGDHFTSLGGIGQNLEADPIPLNPVGTVTAYAYGHPLDANLLYVGTRGNVAGHLLWVRRGVPGYPTPADTYPGTVPWDIAVDPDDPGHAYVLDQNARVWRTVDGGASASGWTDQTGALGTSSTDLRTIEVVLPASGPGAPAVVVGGFGGVFSGTEAGSVSWWRRVGESFPNAIVTDVSYDVSDDLLVAGTYGRGAWTLAAARAELFTSLCGTSPEAGCQAAPTSASSLSLKKGTTDKLKWKWKSGALLEKSDFGDPLSMSPYLLCVYDASGGGSLQVDSLAPAGIGWSEGPKGFKYKSKALTPDGIGKVGLKAGEPGAGKLQVSGKGPNLQLPTVALVPPVTVQFRRNDGPTCWEATYSAPKVNEPGRFKAKSD